MTDELTTNPPNDFESDPVRVATRYGLENRLVQMMSRFGTEGPETALFVRMFYFDADYDLVWQTQFASPTADRLEDAREKALVWACLALFAPDITWAEDQNFHTAEHAFGRWQAITPTLLRLEEAHDPGHPWLYGWAMFGVQLCGQVRAPRLTLWDTKVARAASPCEFDAQVGKVFADELPLCIDDFRALRGIGDATIKRVEKELIEMLLAPEQHAPTMEEMMGTEPFVAERTPGRNDPCSCGSGRKYKKCCHRLM